MANGQEAVERLLGGAPPESPKPTDDRANQAADRLLGHDAPEAQPSDDTESLMGNIKAYVAGIPDAVKAGWRMGWGGEGRAEFDLPELGTAGPSVPPMSEEGLRMMGAYALAVDPQQIADIAVNTLPGATARQDAYGNPIVTFEGKDYYINKPGMSQADLFQFLGQAGLYAPAGRAGLATRNLAGRAARTGTAAALTSGAADIAAGQLGAESGISGERMLFAGAFGAGADLIGPLAKKSWRAIFGRRDLFDPATGALNPRGRQIAEAAGLDPDDLRPEFAKALARNMRDEPIPEVAVAKAYSETQGVPYTLGQQTREFRQMGAEEGMRHGTFGEPARGAMETFGKQQKELMGEATKGVQKQLVRGRPIAGMEAEAGEALIEGMNREVARLNKLIDDAYDLARETNATLTDSGSLQNLKAMLVDSLEEFDLSPDLFPATTRSKKILEGIKPRRGKPVDLRFLELQRRRIGNNIAAAKNPADKAAAVKVKETLDRWLDEAVDNALFDGDPKALENLKKARALRREKGVKFEPQGKDDEAGKVIQRMIDRDPTPEQMANWLFGKGAIGNQDVSAKVAKRLKAIFPEGTAEWDSMREAGWMRMVLDKQGNFLSPTRMKNNLDTALTRSPTLMKELYSPQETSLMRELSRALKATETPPGAQNPSQTAFTIMRALRDLVRRAGTGLTFRGHHFLGGGMFTLGRLLPGNFTASQGARMAKQAIGGMPPYRTRAPGLTAGGLAAGQLAPELEGETP